MRRQDLEAIAEGFGPTIRAYVDKRIKEVTDRRFMAFRGPWDAGGNYEAGDCVQHRGGLYLAMTYPGDQIPGVGVVWRRIAESK